jgi:hypothetical protein
MDVIVSKANLLTKIISIDKQDSFLKLVILTCAAILGKYLLKIFIYLIILLFFIKNKKHLQHVCLQFLDMNQ